MPLFHCNDIKILAPYLFDIFFVFEVKPYNLIQFKAKTEKNKKLKCFANIFRIHLENISNKP